MKNQYKAFRKPGSFLTFIFSVCILIVAQSQDFAGPDKYICSGGSTAIGGTPVPGACYAWTPEDGLSNPHSSNPTVANITSTKTYTVKVVGSNFSFSGNDAVTVHVVEAISDVSIAPKDNKCCWKSGEAISPDQFTITTVPEGLNGLIQNITITPGTAPNLTGNQSGSVEVYFQILTHDCDNLPITFFKTIYIQVVDENNKVHVQITAPIWGLDQGIITSFYGIFPCSPSYGVSVSGYGDYFKICCDVDKGCIKSISEGGIQITGSASVTCGIPVPILPFIDFMLQGSASANGSFYWSETCVENQNCGLFQISAGLGGGIGKKVGGFELSLMVVAEFQLPPIKYCFPPGTSESTGQRCVLGKLVGTVKFPSLIEKSGEWIFWNRCF